MAIRFMCRAKTLKRAEQLRDKAIELNKPYAGGYVGVSPKELPIVFVNFETKELYTEWLTWAKATKGA